MDKTNFSARRRAWGVMMRGLMVLCAVLTCALAVFLIIYVLAKGVPQSELGAAEHRSPAIWRAPSASCRTSSAPCAWC